jgi:uncharacterized protein YecE (DUF72 family)
MSQVRVGCSGWMYDAWRGSFYPPGDPKRRWLEISAEHFDTVEVNATFYRLQSRSTVESWLAQTPADFVFAVKASRFLTHIRRLREIETGIERFYAPLEPLRACGRLGPVLWQLPENFVRDDARLHRWLEILPPGRHTIEFRHPSWFVPEVLSALAARDVALTLGDHPERGFQTREATAAWRYVRFHYGARGRNGNYSERELGTWTRRLAQWRLRGDVFAYFNNDWCGYAPANAARLARSLPVGT